jgi:hypothetical protein
VSDPGSVFRYWAGILKLRKELVDVFVYGSFTLVDKDHEELFVYTRGFGDETAVVVTNFSDKEVKWAVPADVSSVFSDGRYLVGNYEERKAIGFGGGVITVKPFEAFVVLKEGARLPN